MRVCSSRRRIIPQGDSDMSSAESVHPGADMERFVREQMAFVGLREEDVEVIRRTAPFVLKHEAALTAALYEHFLKFPATAKFFLAEDGSPDRVRIERRRHTLRPSLRQPPQLPTSHPSAYYTLPLPL